MGQTTNEVTTATPNTTTRPTNNINSGGCVYCRKRGNKMCFKIHDATSFHLHQILLKCTGNMALIIHNSKNLAKNSYSFF